jgi:hypothetical protein
MSRSAIAVVLAILSSGCVLRYSRQEIDGSWYDDKLERKCPSRRA